ncbi:hypothetical protein AX769_00590 [Frondihabitans sp. PAMC 28766]|uniref:HutD/Ves family protein n=1 Tax=Frondihabitans sp. PAMC 28766 TaxID=1795630 RepID=UPI00078C6D5D|nr:HutD family protein [Frondihabitans sp. PAMC 28766]AMM18910.1 hypothetical protein AX769_00590 [Frondihabitans sp. PAMC 28766]
MATLIRFADLTPAPWANGLGSTTEIARGIGSGRLDSGGADRGGADWDWRISVATIEAATPFSALPGVDRVLMALGPDPLTLMVEGKQHDLQPQETLQFSGEDDVRPVGVDTPGRDVNLMTRRGAFHGSLHLTRIRNGLTVGSTPGTRVALILLEGAGVVAQEGETAPTLQLGPLGTLLGDPGEPMTLLGAATYAQVTLWPANTV